MRKLCSITILIALTPFFGCEKGWVWLLDEPYTVKVSIKETERTEFHIPDDGFFISIFKKRTGNSWDGYSFEDYVGKVSVSEGQSQVIENDIKAANYWFIVGFRAINNNNQNRNVSVSETKRISIYMDCEIKMSYSDPVNSVHTISITDNCSY